MATRDKRHPLVAFLTRPLVKGVPVRRPSRRQQLRKPQGAAPSPAAATRLEEVVPGHGWSPPVLNVDELHVGDLRELMNSQHVGDLALRGYTVIRPGQSGINIDDVIGNLTGGAGASGAAPGGGGAGQPPTPTGGAAGGASASDSDGSDGSDGDDSGDREASTTPAPTDAGQFVEGGSFPLWLLLAAILSVLLLGWAGNSHWLNIPANVWFGMLLIEVAVMFWFGFSQATYTLRAGLASAIFIVFLGVLLFPDAFTSQIDDEMRKEFVNAFQLVLAFYFGTEGAVQAVKAWRGEAGAGGDLDNNTPAAPV